MKLGLGLGVCRGVGDQSKGNPRLVLTVKTDNTGTSATDQFTIPHISTGSYNYTVYFDGTSDTYSGTGGSKTITFPSGAGTYDIEIEGDFIGFRFANGGDRQKAIELKNWGTLTYSGSWDQAFFGCINLTFSATGTPDTSAVTRWDNSFRDCSSMLTAPDLDCSGCTGSARWMFRECDAMTSAPSYDLGSCTTIEGLYYQCTALATVGNITTNTSLTNCSDMFYQCSSLGVASVISNTSNVTDFSQMFYQSSVTEATGLDMTSATNVASMFFQCTSLVEAEITNSSGITNWSSFFSGCTSLTTVTIDTSGATSTVSMFSGCTSLVTAPAMTLTSVTNANSMFFNCTSLTGITGTYAFAAAGCSAIQFMRLCTSLTDVPSGLDCSNFTSCDNIFSNNTGFTTVRAIDFSSATTLSTAFQSCSNMTSCGTLTTSASLTSMNACFNSCASMGTMPSVTNTSAVTTFFRCFRGITSTVSTVPAYDTSAATSTQQMFENSTGMNGVTMPTFNLGAMTNGTNMFAGMNMSTASYDDLLVDIESRNSNASVVFHGGNSTYTDPSAAATARAALIADHSWVISDGGAA